MQYWSVVLWLPTFVEFESKVAACDVKLVTLISDQQSAAYLALEHKLIPMWIAIIMSAQEIKHCNVSKLLNKDNSDELPMDQRRSFVRRIANQQVRIDTKSSMSKIRKKNTSGSKLHKPNIC